jgi:hypothetical protein
VGSGERSGCGKRHDAGGEGGILGGRRLRDFREGQPARDRASRSRLILDPTPTLTTTAIAIAVEIQRAAPTANTRERLSRSTCRGADGRNRGSKRNLKSLDQFRESWFL